LKYDEVYSEQRKVIYGRRLQIIDGDDLRPLTEELIGAAVTRSVADCCPNEFAEEWDLARLLVEIQKYYPTKFTIEDLEPAISTEQITESLLSEVTDYYDERERTFPGGEETARQLERNIMLQIIDQRWRQHLVEMDYLREGIGLRGMAQQDPLVAWQREGFEMFEQLLAGIDDDYLQYVLHAQVVLEEPEGNALEDASYEAQTDPLEPSREAVAFPPAELEKAPPAPAGAGAPAAGAKGPPTRGAAAAPVAGVPGRQAKIGRNDPCYCGSGKKYKLCHGAS
ncbi:MAG: SEC-C metal-binding domain-containing protein, partial [Acidimicrobiales bacterium]